MTCAGRNGMALPRRLRPLSHIPLSEILRSNSQLERTLLMPPDHLYSEKLFRQTASYRCSGLCFPHFH